MVLSALMSCSLRDMSARGEKSRFRASVYPPYSLWDPVMMSESGVAEKNDSEKDDHEGGGNNAAAAALRAPSHVSKLY